MHKIVAYIITLCVFGFCPSFEADSCVHCSFRACVFTATSFVLLLSCARHLLSNSVSYSFAERPTCIRYPVNSFVFYDVEYLVYCRFLTFIAMGDRLVRIETLRSQRSQNPLYPRQLSGLWIFLE